MAKEMKEKMEDVLNGEEFETTEIGGEKMENKKINWKLYGKCVLGVAIVGVASIAVWKWRKSKKVSTTAVVVSTPSSADSVDSQVASTPNTTVVEI